MSNTTKEVVEVASLDGESLRAAATGTALAVQQTEVERVTTALSDAEWDDVPDGHIGGTVKARLPRVLSNMKVGQKASADQKASGFTDELTGEVFTEATFVWLGDTVTRAYFPLPFGEGDKEPACRAADGTTPDPSSPAQQPGWTVPVDRKGNAGEGTVPAKKCGDCPNAVWGRDGTPPPCSASVEVMIYLTEQQRLSLIRFGGMGVGRVNKYLGALEAHVPNRPPLAYVTKVELEEKDTPNGTFLVPRFTPVGDIPRSEATPLIELQKAKLSEWVEQLSADLAEGATREGAEATKGPFDGDGLDPNRPFDESDVTPRSRPVPNEPDPHAEEMF